MLENEGLQPKPIAVTLHGLNDEAKRDFPRLLERIAEIGYLGVETAGLHGMPAEEFRRRVDNLGLSVTSSQLFSDDLDQELDDMQTIGTDRLISDIGPDCFATSDAIATNVAEFNQMAAQVRDRGMSLGYTNHWWEYTPTEAGPSPINQLLEHLDPDVFLELDVYYVASAWHQTRANEPMEALANVADRVRLVHVKDGPCTRAEPGSPTAVDLAGLLLDPSTAVGDGVVDIDPMLTALPQAEWHIVEFDSTVPEPFAVLEKSYQYLTTSGLSQGRDS
jgi:sugar phosphate isomerase/epimerase